MSKMKRELEKQQARADAAKGFTNLQSKISNLKGGTINYGRKNLISVIPLIGGFTTVRKEAKGGLQEATARLKAQGLKKGGPPKKKKKFPDLSGDGKVTMKDILMARGVIKKKTKKKGKKK